MKKKHEHLIYSAIGLVALFLILVAAKQRRVTVQKTIQLGFEGPQLLPVHERFLPWKTAGEEGPLVPFSPFA